MSDHTLGTLSDQLQTTLDTLPETPGVYIMKNARGTVIYVGKAVSLRSRVRNYFQASTQREQPKVRRMVMDIATLDYILVKNETEALMLECTLIKQHQPRYNILLKDDKHFPYIRIDMAQKFPRVEVVRTMRKRDRARYFGPYLGAGTVRNTLETIRKVFPIRTCKKDIDRAIRNGERPCLNAQLGLCMAPCSGQVSSAQYRAVIEDVCKFLAGQYTQVAQQLRAQMLAAAEALEFERAAVLRDKLQVVQRVLDEGAGQNAISTAREDIDIIGVSTLDEDTAVQLVMMRAGKIIASEGFMITGAQDASPASVARSFMEQFYLDSVQLPHKIVLGAIDEDFAPLREYLCAQAGRKVEFIVPQRGEKRRLLEMAHTNARERIERERAGRRREWERTGGALQALAQAIGMVEPPQRIECFDISNIQGTDSVASMVVMEQGKPARSQYRRFKIKTVEGANDFLSMAEVLTRRFAHARREQEQGEGAQPKFARLPDLVVVDGGRIQLDFARRAMAAQGAAHIMAIGLAERNEHIILADRPDPLILPKSSPAVQLLQRIRDEAHRFAITYHRSLRTARTLRSRLDDAPGIGPVRRRALLRAFPIQQQMLAATPEELAAVEGMNAKAAQSLWDYLHEPPADPPA